MKHSRPTYLVLSFAAGFFAIGNGFVVGGETNDLASKQRVTREAMRLLKAECFACHNPEKKKGGLVLTSRDALLQGGDDGLVVVLGDPEASLLPKALLADADPHMPPKKQLADSQIKVIREWIKNSVEWDAAALADDETLISLVELSALPATYKPVMAMAASPDGKNLAVARGGSIVIHDLAKTNLPMIAQMDAHVDAVQALAWSSDGRWLASGAFRRIALWDGASFALEGSWADGLFGSIGAIEFSPDSEKLVASDGVGTQNGYVRVVSLSEDKVVDSWRAHDDTIFDLNFSHDGLRLVTAGGDKLIKVWEFAAKKEIAKLEGHTAQVLSVAFNTNATQVVSGGADKQLSVWDIQTREKISSLGRHASAITSVRWPDDGKTIFACTDDGAAYSYKNVKAHTGEQSSASGDERKIGEADDALLCLTTTPDAKMVFAGAHDGVVHVWNDERKLLAKLLPATNTVVSNFASSLNARSSRSKEALIPSSPNAPVAADVRASSPRLLQNEVIVSLSAEPKELQLSADAPRHGLMISARTTAGFEIDVSDETRFTAGPSAPFEVKSSGEVRALKDGEGVLTAEFKGQTIEIPVKVSGTDATLNPAQPSRPPVSFGRDVLPVLSRAGCNAGACHAKPEGQNGFKLSVFSYDPKSDYAEIVKDARGRRIFPAAPDESLLIKKPTTAIPHEGGLRFERGSETHQLLVQWLREGMPYSVTNEPALTRLIVFPKERRYRKGATQRLLIQAHYSDGSMRDVTRLAAFDSNDKEIAKPDEHGLVTIGTLTGQGVVVARYMGLVADAQIIVPANNLLPEAKYAALSRNSFIDDLAYAQYQQLGLFPSDLCADAEFLRRAKLDAIGVLPTASEVRAFLADPSPDKRRKLIARVLEDPAYADYWANKWADLLRPNPDRVGVKSIFTLDQWLRESFRKNKPYDQFVREILLAEGTNHRDGPAVVYRDRRDPADLTTMFSQLFLGTRLECARCHHHPNEKWAQEDFYQFAAFFGPLKQKGAGLSPPISAGTETFYFSPGGTVKHPITGSVMTPRPPDGRECQTPEGTDPRRALADWLTTPENPFFARAAVNRIWAVFFGRGLVDPVDDFRVSNPCVNPALLSALADDFAKHKFDLKHLMRTIMESRLYQLSSTPNEFNLADTRNFSRAYRRRLPAEVLLDAVNDVTEVPDTFAAMPVGTRATQAWSYKIESQFMDAFGRPNASSDCPCERDTHLSVVQSLHLMNSKTLQSKLSNPKGAVRRLAESSQLPIEIVIELYLTTLNRPPTGDELKTATAAFAAPEATRQTASEDVLWALLNSAEFVFNH